MFGTDSFLCFHLANDWLASVWFFLIGTFLLLLLYCCFFFIFHRIRHQDLVSINILKLSMYISLYIYMLIIFYLITSTGTVIGSFIFMFGSFILIIESVNDRQLFIWITSYIGLYVVYVVCISSLLYTIVISLMLY